MAAEVNALPTTTTRVAALVHRLEQAARRAANGAILREAAGLLQDLEAERARLATDGPPARRHRLPDDRPSITRKLKIPLPDGGEFKLYVSVSTYADGRPAEMFLRADKVGSFAHGLLDALAVAVSVGLQYGVPLSTYVRKMRFSNFQPAGLTGMEDIKNVSSPLDAIAQWLAKRFP